MTTLAPAQLDLFAGTVEVPTFEDKLNIEDRFLAFHALNPHVLTALETLAAEWLAYNRRTSTKFLFEVLRYRSSLATRGEAWKLNNNFTSLYARLMLARHPEWEGRIETRALAAERH